MRFPAKYTFSSPDMTISIARFVNLIDFSTMLISYEDVTSLPSEFLMTKDSESGLTVVVSLVKSAKSNSEHSMTSPLARSACNVGFSP